MYEKNPVGRPPKWKDAEELQEQIDEYFKSCDLSGKPYTITGLALALDTDRQTLINYQRKEDFFDTIKKAKLRILDYAEQALYDPARKNNVGIIFSLKNNFGYVDKTEVDVNGKMEYSIKLPEDLEEE